MIGISILAPKGQIFVGAASNSRGGIIADSDDYKKKKLKSSGGGRGKEEPCEGTSNSRKRSRRLENGNEVVRSGLIR